MLLVAAHSEGARVSLRNALAAHEETVVRRFGRAVLLQETAFAGFIACRLRAEYGTAIQVERTEPFVAAEWLSESVQSAATAYANREVRTTPYSAFAADTAHPDPDEMKEIDI
jgi:hypothetical protein